MSGMFEHFRRKKILAYIEQTSNIYVAFFFQSTSCHSDVFVIVAIAVLTMDQHRSDWVPALRMYRGVFLVILFIFLLGLNTYGWRSSGVNHVLIFELDPRNNLTHQQLLEVSSICCLGLKLCWDRNCGFAGEMATDEKAMNKIPFRAHEQIGRASCRERV